MPTRPPCRGSCRTLRHRHHYRVHAGDIIAVGSDQNPRGFPLALRPNTVYEGDASNIKMGVRVTVWYRNVSERRLVVEKVRVLDRVVPRYD